MVVITVIALASAAAVMAMPDPRGRLVDEATRFAGRVRAAQAQAIVGARPVSLWVTAGGYGFDERRGGRWVPMGEKPLLVSQWNEGTSVTATARERVVFDETGLADQPLSVPLRRGATAVSVRIDGDGRVRVEA